MGNPDKQELASLQILRAVAALSVVYFHIAATPTVGSFGVDIFFVLSGFVIAMVVSRGQTARMFVISRIARIVPIYWVMTTLLLVVAFKAPALLNATTANLGNYLKSLFFVPYYKENGLLYPMLSVGWSLNYEMQFYACVALAMAVARPRWMAVVIALLCAGFVLLGVLSTSAVRHEFYANNIIFEFVFGLAAYKVFEKKWMADLPAWLLLCFAVSAYAALALCELAETADVRCLTTGLPALVIVLCVVHLEQRVRSLPARVLAAGVIVGDSSYAIYLSHSYVVEGVKKIFSARLHWIDPFSFQGIALILFGATLVGYGLYVAVDRPLSRWVKRVLAGIQLRMKTASN